MSPPSFRWLKCRISNVLGSSHKSHLIVPPCSATPNSVKMVFMAPAAPVPPAFAEPHVCLPLFPRNRSLDNIKANFLEDISHRWSIPFRLLFRRLNHHGNNCRQLRSNSGSYSGCPGVVHRSKASANSCSCSGVMGVRFIGQFSAFYIDRRHWLVQSFLFVPTILSASQYNRKPIVCTMANFLSD